MIASVQSAALSLSRTRPCPPAAILFAAKKMAAGGQRYGTTAEPHAADVNPYPNVCMFFVFARSLRNWTSGGHCLMTIFVLQTASGMCSLKAELIQCARATGIPSLASSTLQYLQGVLKDQWRTIYLTGKPQVVLCRQQ